VAFVHGLSCRALDADSDEQCSGADKPGDKAQNQSRRNIPGWRISTYAGLRKTSAHYQQRLGSKTIPKHGTPSLSGKEQEIAGAI